MAQPFPRTPSKKAGDFTPLRNGSNTFHQSTLVQILQWIEDNWLEGRELVSNLKRRVNFQAGIARRHDFVRLFKACCEASGYCRHIVVREIYRGGMDRPPIKVDVKVNLGMSPVTAAEFYGPKPTAPVIPMNTSLAAEPSDRRKRIENWVERNIQKPVDVLSPAQPDLPEDGGSKRCGKVAHPTATQAQNSALSSGLEVESKNHRFADLKEALEQVNWIELIQVVGWMETCCKDGRRTLEHLKSRNPRWKSSNNVPGLQTNTMMPHSDLVDLVRYACDRSPDCLALVEKEWLVPGAKGKFANRFKWKASNEKVPKSSPTKEETRTAGHPTPLTGNVSLQTSVPPTKRLATAAETSRSTTDNQQADIRPSQSSSLNGMIVEGRNLQVEGTSKELKIMTSSQHTSKNLTKEHQTRNLEVGGEQKPSEVRTRMHSKRKRRGGMEVSMAEPEDREHGPEGEVTKVQFEAINKTSTPTPSSHRSSKKRQNQPLRPTQVKVESEQSFGVAHQSEPKEQPGSHSDGLQRYMSRPNRPLPLAQKSLDPLPLPSIEKDMDSSPLVKKKKTSRHLSRNVSAHHKNIGDSGDEILPLVVSDLLDTDDVFGPTGEDDEDAVSEDAAGRHRPNLVIPSFSSKCAWAKARSPSVEEDDAEDEDWIRTDNETDDEMGESGIQGESLMKVEDETDDEMEDVADYDLTTVASKTRARKVATKTIPTPPLRPEFKPRKTKKIAQVGSCVTPISPEPRLLSSCTQLTTKSLPAKNLSVPPKTPNKPPPPAKPSLSQPSPSVCSCRKKPLKTPEELAARRRLLNRRNNLKFAKFWREEANNGPPEEKAQFLQHEAYYLEQYEKNID